MPHFISPRLASLHVLNHHPLATCMQHSRGMSETGRRNCCGIDPNTTCHRCCTGDDHPVTSCPMCSSKLMPALTFGTVIGLAGSEGFKHRHHHKVLSPAEVQCLLVSAAAGERQIKALKRHETCGSCQPTTVAAGTQTRLPTARQLQLPLMDTAAKAMQSQK